MKIAISINGVLRDYLENVSVAAEIDNKSIHKHIFKNPYNLMEMMDALKIKASRVKLMDGTFKENDRIENLIKFFIDYGFTIFADMKGIAYRDVFMDLSLLGNINEVYLYSNENGIIMNFTNKFILDNSMGESNNYKGILYSYDKDFFKHIDCIITDNPTDINKFNKMGNIEVIKLEKYYNADIDIAKSGKTLKEINSKYFNITVE